VRATGLTDDGYSRVQYLTFTGTQYIDMGVDAVGNTKVTVDYQYTTRTAWGTVFGSRQASYNSMWFGIGSNTAYYAYYYGSTAAGSETLYNAVADTSRHTVVADNTTVQIDSLAPTTVTASTPTGSYNLYLGTLNDSGTPNSAHKYLGQIYSAVIDKDGGTNDRYFVPVQCLRSGGCTGLTNNNTAAAYGEYGMYDTLHEVFYHAGAGTLSGGGTAPTVPLPTISTVSPDSGDMMGGDTVVVTGTNLTGGSVRFDGTIASCEVNSDTQMTCLTPSHSAGVVDVDLSTAGGKTTLTDGFTYTVVVPTLSADQHYFAADKAGQTLTINGSQLLGPAYVSGFQRVGYLAFNGSQYINMGVDAVGNTKVTADFQYTTRTTWGTVFGSRQGAYHLMVFGLPSNTNYYTYYYGSTSTGFDTLFNAAANTNRHTVVANNNVVQVDNLTPATVAAASAPTASYDMYLGTLNDNNAPNSAHKYLGQIYSIRIDKDGTINDRNFVPVVCDKLGGCNSSVNTGSTTVAFGEYGMYDILHSVFYRASAGTLGGGGTPEPNIPTITAVKVDGVDVPSYTVVSDTEMTVEVPSHVVTSSPVAVEITSSEWGTVTLTGADGLNFAKITDPIPASGSTGGGTVVTVSGSGFIGSSLSVTVGGSPATDIITVDDNTLTFKTPDGTVGTVDVVISGLGSGESLTLANAWEYVDLFIEISVNKPNLTMSGLPNELITDNLTVNVKTDNPTGYNLTIEASDTNLTCQTDNTKKITALPNTTSTSAMVNQWGYARDDEVTPTTPSSWTGLTIAGASLKNTTTPQADPTLGEDTRVWFGTKVDWTLPACSYTGSVTFTAIAW
jgi:hypothetical protein